MNTYFRCLESRIDKNNTLYGKFSLNSILSGQGNTFANSLRRSLFSDLSGLAITHFCITSKPGLGYEFATLPGLAESVLDFSLNLKKVVLTGRVIDHEMQKITTLSSNLNNVCNGGSASSKVTKDSNIPYVSLLESKNRCVRNTGPTFYAKHQVVISKKSTNQPPRNAGPQRFVRRILTSCSTSKGRCTSKTEVKHVRGTLTGVSRPTFGQAVTRDIRLRSTPLLIAKESPNITSLRQDYLVLRSFGPDSIDLSESRLGRSKQQRTFQKISSALPIAPIGFLKVKGPAVLRAKDLILPPGIRCVHPNQYLGTLAADGALSIKFLIAAGKGFIVQDEILYNSLSRAKLLFSSNGTEINNPGLDTQTKQYPTFGDAKRRASKASLTYFKDSKKSTKVSLPYSSINGIATLTTKDDAPITSFGVLTNQRFLTVLLTNRRFVTDSIEGSNSYLRSNSNGFTRSSVAVPRSIRKEHLKAQLKINFGISSLPTGKAYLRSKQLTGMLLVKASHTSFGVFRNQRFLTNQRTTKGLCNQRMWSEKLVQESKKQSGSSVAFTNEHASNKLSICNNRAKLPKDAKLVRFYPSDEVSKKSTNCHYVIDTKHQTFKNFLGSCDSSGALTNAVVTNLASLPSMLSERSTRSMQSTRFVRPMGYIATKDSVRPKSFHTKRFKETDSKAKKQINDKPSQTKRSTGLAQSFLPYGGFNNTVTANSSKKLSKKQLLWGAEENFYPVLPLDVTFTPISKVNFQINVDRNSEKNEETIIFEIWTNGSITPKRAIQESCLALAQDFYNLFCHVNEFSSLQFWWKRESIESKVTRSATFGRTTYGFGSKPYLTSKKQLPVYFASRKKESSQIASFGSYQEFKQNTTYKDFLCKKETEFMLNQGLSLFNRFILYPTVDYKSQMNLPCSKLHPLVGKKSLISKHPLVATTYQRSGSPLVATHAKEGTLPTANNLDIIVSSENQTGNKKMHSQVKNSTRVKFPESKNLKLKQKVQYLHAFWRLNVSDLNLSLKTQLLLKKLNINSVYDLHFFILKKSWSLFLNRQQQKEIIKIYLNFGLNSPF